MGCAGDFRGGISLALRGNVTQRTKGAMPILGWREYISLPELELPSVRVKVDTGARSSAISVSDIELYTSGSTLRVRFHANLEAERPNTEKVDLPVEAMRSIKSSNGAVEQRITVKTRYCIGEHEYAFDLTLTDRAGMKFPMLLGREAIRGRFLVDSGKSFLFGKAPFKRHGKKKNENRNPI